VVSFTPRPLYRQGKSPWYPLDRRLDGPQSRSGCGGEKNSQPLPGLEPRIIQPVAQRYTTELSRLLQLLDSVTVRSSPFMINLYLLTFPFTLLKERSSTGKTSQRQRLSAVPFILLTHRNCDSLLTVAGKLRPYSTLQHRKEQ
jgi:hypothetical protein